MTDHSQPPTTWMWPLSPHQEPTATPEIIAKPNGMGGFVVIKEGYRIE